MYIIDITLLKRYYRVTLIYRANSADDGTMSTSGLDAGRQTVLDQLLMEAVGNKDLAHVQLYVEKGANVNMSVGTLYDNISRNSNSQSLNREAFLLHFLYSKGLRTDIADYLIAQGVDVDMRDAQGNTALMIAAKQGDIAGVKYFVSKGADPMAGNNRGEIVLEEARGLQAYYHSSRQQIIDTLVSAMPTVGNRPAQTQAEIIELPQAVNATPLQKRLNNRFKP
jgi:hypothetical protein